MANKQIKHLDKLYIEMNENNDIVHDPDLDDDAKFLIQLSNGRNVHVTLKDFYILMRRLRVGDGEIINNE